MKKTLKNLLIVVAAAFMVVGVVACDDNEEDNNREISETETGTETGTQTGTETGTDVEDTIASSKEAATYTYTFACSEDLLELLQPQVTYTDKEGVQHTDNIDDFFRKEEVRTFSGATEGTTDTVVYKIYAISNKVKGYDDTVYISYNRTNKPIENRGYLMQRSFDLSSASITDAEGHSQLHTFISINIDLSSQGYKDNKLYGDKITEYVDNAVSTRDSLTVTYTKEDGVVTSKDK